MLMQSRLDLAGLDPVAAQLQHAAEPAGIAKLSRRKRDGEVAGAVPGRPAVGGREQALGAELRLVQVAGCEAGSPELELARAAGRGRLSV
jgi:hypothetical protein